MARDIASSLRAFRGQNRQSHLPFSCLQIKAVFLDFPSFHECAYLIHLNSRGCKGPAILHLNDAQHHHHPRQQSNANPSSIISVDCRVFRASVVRYKSSEEKRLVSAVLKSCAASSTLVCVARPRAKKTCFAPEVASFSLTELVAHHSSRTHCWLTFGSKRRTNLQ